MGDFFGKAAQNAKNGIEAYPFGIVALIEASDAMNPEIMSWAAGIERQVYQKDLPASLDPVAGEIIGARLVRLVGLGAPAEIRVGESVDAVNTAIWMIKAPDAGGRLKQFKPELATDPVPTHFVLVERIPNAISLTALRNRFGITARLPGKGLTTSLMDELSIEANRRGFISTDELMADRRLYSDRALVQDVTMLVRVGKDNGAPFDFCAPADWDPVRTAIDWGSEQMLLIHAARALMACSTAHAGNILVDANGKLYSVDHECCALTDLAEIDLLRENVRPGTRSHRAMERIAEISDQAMTELFEDLPEVDWPMGDRATTVQHFIARLDRWRGRRAKGAAASH